MRLKSSRIGLAAVAGALALTAAAQEAKADVTIYDKDGWSVWTNGRAAAHLQYTLGDGNPVTPNTLIGGFSGASAVDADNKVTTARIRSGWVGTQLGMGVANQVNDDLKVKAYFAMNLLDIANDGDKTQSKNIDFREGFGAAEGSWGTVIFGRALSIWGTALAGTVYMYSYGDGIGHPCSVEGIDISCGPVGAGAIFPGFNAQVQYQSPNFDGFGFRVGLYDPARLDMYNLRPLPRVEGELSYELPVGDDGKVQLIGQGMWQTIGRLVVDPATMAADKESVSVLGGILGARLEISGFYLGVGDWGGKGLGTNVSMQDFTPQGTTGGAVAVDDEGDLRSFTGFMGHGKYRFGDTEVGAGAGTVMISETDNDEAVATRSVLESNLAIHVVLYHHIGPLVLGAEFMNWKSKWHRGEEQTLNFMGVGANFLW